MKNLKYIFALIIYSSLILNANEYVELSKLNYDFIGIEKYENNIIAYGNSGMSMVSHDGGENWKEVRISSSGESIFEIFFSNEKYIAFSSKGNVFESYDEGKSWESIAGIGKEIREIEKSGEFFFALARHSLIKMNSDYSVTEEAMVNDTFLLVNNNYNKYNKYFTTTTERVYVTLNEKVLMFNHDLMLLDSVLGGSFDGCLECNIPYLFKSWDDEVFCRVDNQIRPLDTNKSIQFYINSIPDEAGNNTFADSLENPFILRRIDNEYYSFNPITALSTNHFYYSFWKLNKNENSELVTKVTMDEFGTSNQSNLEDKFYIQDFTILNNKVFFVDINKSLKYVDIKSRKRTIVSDFRGLSDLTTFQFEFSNGNLYFLTEKSLSKSTNNGNTFFKLNSDAEFFNDNSTSSKIYPVYLKNTDEIFYIYIEINKNTIYKLGSNDNFISFAPEELEMKDNVNFTEMEYLNGEYIISYWTEGYKIFNNRFYYDKEFNLLNKVVDSLYTFDEIHHVSESEFYIFSKDSTYLSKEEGNPKEYLKKVTNKGQSVEIIKTFENYNDTTWLDKEKNEYYAYETNELLDVEKVKVDNQLVWVFCTFNKVKREYKLNTFNFDTEEIKTFYERESDRYLNFEISEYSDTLLFSIEDTLYKATDLYNQIAWEKYPLPQNGKFVNGKFHYSEAGIFGLYLSDISPIGIYRAKLLKPLLSTVVEDQAETENYVYTMKPYPLPASDRVTVDIYLSESPETIQTSVYNSEGVKIDNGENIEITGGRWPGQLTWECGSQSPGVYYIQIISGSKKHAIPVVVGE